MNIIESHLDQLEKFWNRNKNMAENNKRKCPSINSGMLDKLNNFTTPRTSLGLGKLGYQEFEELLSNLVVTDSETGVRIVDSDAVKALAAELGSYVDMLKNSAEALVGVVDSVA